MDLPKFEIEEYSEVVYHGLVQIDGAEFDAINLLNILKLIQDEDDIVITDTKMVEVLKKYEIIEYGGNYRSCIRASGGKRLSEFIFALEDRMESFEYFKRWREK